MSKVFSVADVASHSSKDDLYIIVDGDVYDLTKFQTEHPGMHPPQAGDHACIGIR
jgi:cytochrome b involved in lipid metabolism